MNVRESIARTTTAATASEHALRTPIHDIYFPRAHLIQTPYRFSDLPLVRIGAHLKHVHVVFALLGGFLCDVRLAQDTRDIGIGVHRWRLFGDLHTLLLGGLRRAIRCSLSFLFCISLQKCHTYVNYASAVLRCGRFSRSVIRSKLSFGAAMTT